MKGDVSFIEFGTTEPNTERSRSFFQQIFGWQVHPMPKGCWFQTASIRIGLHDNDPGPQIYVFFEVPDLDQAVEMVRRCGGEADPPLTEEEDFGRFATCRDPQGVRFGLHQRPMPASSS
jgi:uncharacterized protein